MYMYILAFSCSGYTLIYLAPPPPPKIVPFKKRVKNPRQKWYHFSQKRVIIPRQKNTISKKGQNCPG